MKASNLLFKKRISILGLIVFIVSSIIKISYSIFKWSLQSLVKTFKWLRNYIHFIKSGYSYSDIYNLVNSMSGREFEVFCSELFKELGYKVTLTKESCDGGKDIILYSDEDGYTYVECKRWNENLEIGRVILQKLVGAVTADNIDNALILCTCKYNKNAYEYANKLDNLKLWDINNIMKILYKIDQKRIPYILTKSLGSDTKIVKLKPCIK